MTTCPECGAAVEDNLRLCAECGRLLRPQSSSARTERGTSELDTKGDSHTLVVAGGDIQQDGSPGAGRSTIVAGGDVVQKGHTNPAGQGTASRQIITAGQDVIQAGGDVYKANGDMVVNLTVVEGLDHDQYLAEYRHRFRELVEVLKRAKRTWLRMRERQQLTELAARLRLRDWEQVDIERDVQERLQFVLGTRPTEMWHVAVGTQYLAKDKERQDVIESLADYLDRHDEIALKVWRKGLPDWVSLGSQPELLADIRERRKARYGELLTEAGRANRLDASREALDRAAKGVSTADQHALWRAAEQRCGHKLEFRPATPPPAAPAPAVDMKLLRGKFEAVKDFSIRLEVSGRTLSLCHTKPYLQEGTARIDDLTIDETGRFAFKLSRHSGDFARIAGMKGHATKDKLVVDALKGAELRDEDLVFVKDYKRQA